MNCFEKLLLFVEESGIIKSYKIFYKFTNNTKWLKQFGDTENNQELLICVPSGNPNKNPSGFWEDSTRLPKFYDGTYQYLNSLGIEDI